MFSQHPVVVYCAGKILVCLSIFTVKITTDLACALRWCLCNSSGYSEPVIHVSLGIPCVYLNKPIRVFGLFRQVTPCGNSLTFFDPPSSPFGDVFCFLPSLYYDLLPLQNLASHNLVSQRQSVVVLTVKMVYYFITDMKRFQIYLKTILNEIDIKTTCSLP